MSGLACLIQIRHDADGVPDATRSGVCVEPQRCTAIAMRFPDAYRCQLTPPDAGLADAGTGG